MPGHNRVFTRWARHDEGNQPAYQILLPKTPNRVGCATCAIREPAAYLAILRLRGCSFGSAGTNCAKVSRTRAFGEISATLAGAWTWASAFTTGGTMVGWVVSNTMACGHLRSERILKVGFSVATTLSALAATGSAGA